jgi:C4-type Zn-finger protein
MNAKIDLLKDMEYLTDIEMLSTLILDQCKKKETPTLTEMSKAIARIFFYVNNLQMDRKMYDKAMSQYREDKNRAVLRSRKAEIKIEELERELKIWKKI